MSDEPADRLIAWINNDKLYIESYIMEAELREFSSVYYKTSADALEELVSSKRVCAVVSELDIAPGMNNPDPEIKEIVRSHHMSIPYWRVALRTLEVIRSPSSINSGVPAIIATIYDPEIDPLCPNARRKCLSAGLDYLYLVENLRVDNLISKLSAVAMPYQHNSDPHQRIRKR